MTVEVRSKISCSVPGCWKKYGEKNISMHFIPQDPKIRQCWIELCKIADTVAKTSRICSVHFCEKDFYNYDKIKRRKIRPKAVPSRNLPANIEEARKLKVLSRSRKKRNALLIERSFKIGNQNRNTTKIDSIEPETFRPYIKVNLLRKLLVRSSQVPSKYQWKSCAPSKTTEKNEVMRDA